MSITKHDPFNIHPTFAPNTKLRNKRTQGTVPPWLLPALGIPWGQMRASHQNLPIKQSQNILSLSIHQSPWRISRSDVQVAANSPGRRPGSPSILLLLPHRRHCRCLLLDQHTQVFPAPQKRWEGCPLLLRNPTGSWEKLEQQQSCCATADALGRLS